jgi:hypothetical protein
LSNRQREVSDAIIRHHIRPLFLFLASENGSLGRRGMIRFFNRCGNLTLPIVVHAMADIMAKGEVLKGRDSGFHLLLRSPGGGIYRRPTAPGRQCRR